MASFGLHNQDIEQSKQELQEQTDQADYWSPVTLLARMEVFLEEDVKRFGSQLSRYNEQCSYVYNAIRNFDLPHMVETALELSRRAVGEIEAVYGAQKSVIMLLKELMDELRSSSAMEVAGLLAAAERATTAEDLAEIQSKITSAIQEAIQEDSRVQQIYQDNQQALYGAGRILAESSFGAARVADALLDELERVTGGTGSLGKTMEPVEEIKVVAKQADALVESLHALLPAEPE